MRTRSSSKNKNKNKWKWVWISLSVVVVLILAGVAVWGAGIIKELDSFQKKPEDSIFKDIEPDKTVEIPKWEGKERVNIMLLGGDARDAQEGEIARSDSILVASFDPVTKKAHLFSVLRDTYGEIEGYRGRINSAITIGGPSLAMKTVGELLGLEIQYFVYTDFEGFKSLIDTIGGIYFEVEKDMRYTDNADKNRYDINLKKGYQLLDGDKALQYVRFRHDAMSDYTRTERQRNFLKAVAKELQSTWNLIRMKEILESVSPYIETNLSVTDMLKLGQLGVDSHVGGSAQIPPMELVEEKTVGGASVIGIRDADALRGYVQEILSTDETIPVPSETPDANGGNSSGSASSGGVSGSTGSRS
ncbi:LytR family transcriptional regulator [Paenibacillus sp. 1011MAR3C5]|uniref:LCP family protein n=1 Tax=Paenibacillus sp. 1011MAR3C5 TaxID=1675787 RepID=UPI000E6CF470|nr:LCP family protein [Paenibacillus sp. 1011MAR3C5]RJE88652.1 LytR family transcriptional regulator [Paenibacillus sp. 1011MAR3C5]